MDQIENHMLAPIRPSIGEIEEKLALINVRHDALYEAVGFSEKFIVFCENMGVSSKRITDFYDWACGEMLDAETERDILLSDLKRFR